MTTTRSSEAKFSCLIVEDDVAFATMSAQVVRAEGGEPTVCHTLAAGRNASQDTSFQLVLLDNHLPDGKAYDFFDSFARRNPAAPIVMITGEPDAREAVALTKNGLFDYLIKPINLDALAACLQRAKLRLAGPELPGRAQEFFGASAPMRAVMEQLAPLGAVYQAGTLSGNPVATACGLATLHEISKPGFFEDLTRKTRSLVTGLAAAAAAQGVPFSADSEGGMFGFFLLPELPQNYPQVMKTDSARFNKLFHGLLDRGVYIAPALYEAGFVSAAHTDADIAATVAAASEVFKSL